MKKSIIILVSFLINTSYITAQTPTLQWQKTLGGTLEDMASTIIQTSDGGYLTVGYSYSSDGNVTLNHGVQDYWVVKLNATGTIEWQKSLGGSDEDTPTSVVQTTDGGYVVAGFTASTDGDVTGNHGEYDYWVVKLNSTGTILWQKTYGGTNNDMAYSIAPTSDSGFIVAGLTTSYDGDINDNNGGGDVWIVKINSSGVLQWQKTLGGTSSDQAKSISQTADGGYVMAGKTYSNDLDVSGNHGDYDFWVVKLDSAGTIQWQKALGGTNEDEAISIIKTTDGGYAVAGIIYSNASNGNITGQHGEHDFWVVKLNSLGTIQWQRPLGGSNSDRGYSIVQTNDGGFVVAGSCQSYNGDVVTGNNDNGGVWLVKLNAAGVVQWQKPFGGSEYEEAFSLIKTTDGGFAVAGFTYSNDGDVSGNHGDSDFWILKLSGENLGTTDFQRNAIIVYPNPVTDVLQIQGVTEPITAIKIIDLTGKTVLEQTTSNHFFDVELLPQGIYLLEVYTEKYKHTHKFTKQ